MNFHLPGIACLAVFMVVACHEPQAAPVRAPMDASVQRSIEHAPAVGVSAPAPMPARAERHRVTRIIDKDPDGDGIANRRIVITETFDDAGVLLESVREIDREADGIIDAREVTSYGE